MSEENKQKLIDFLKKESNGHYTEFRLVVCADRSCYIHVMNKDSNTFDFALESSTPENPPPPPHQ